MAPDLSWLQKTDTPDVVTAETEPAWVLGDGSGLQRTIRPHTDHFPSKGRGLLESQEAAGALETLGKTILSGAEGGSQGQGLAALPEPLRGLL